MHSTFNKFSALRILRFLRQNKESVRRLPRTNLQAPNPAPAHRWTAEAINLESLAPAVPFSDDNPLDVAVNNAANRLRIKSVHNTVYAQGLPEQSFVTVRDGICISSPELLFVETAPLMSTAAHVLLGYELCGTYGRDFSDPRNGDAIFNIPAVTDVQSIRSFINLCHNVRGTTKALDDLKYVANNAWSPVEAIIAAVLRLPIWEYGYAFGNVTLNKRVDPSTYGSAGFAAQYRVPDIVIDGSPVGINYDGDEHIDVDSVVQAALQLGKDPEDQESQSALQEAIREARAKILDDKRRDRELGSRGLYVLAVTKEDLYNIGQFEGIVHLILDGMKSHGGFDVSQQRSYLNNNALKQKRQDLVWSLLPGRRSIAIAHRLEEERLARLCL